VSGPQEGPDEHHHTIRGNSMIDYYVLPEHPVTQHPVPEPKRGLPVWALVLIIVGVLLLGLVAGGAGGYFGRGPEVNRAEQALADSKAETAAARQDAEQAHHDADATQASLDSAETRLVACTDALAELHFKIVQLLGVSSSVLNGDYLTAATTLESMNTSSSSSSERACKRSGGVFS